MYWYVSDKYGHVKNHTTKQIDMEETYLVGIMVCIGSVFWNVFVLAPGFTLDIIV